MVTLDKQVLKSYINTECDRYLFLELGEGSGDWMNPISAITPPSSPPFHLKVLEALGKKYERKIYDILLELPFTLIKRYSLRSLHSRILRSAKDGLLLIEYEFMQSKSFARRVFPKKDASTPLPISQYRFRPDITIIRKMNGNQVHELLPDGAIRRVTKGELSNRLGISVIDIKNIRKESVGKKEFIEILYYMKLLSFMIREYHLESFYFVNLNYNGILPAMENLDEFDLKSPVDITDFIVPVDWNEFGYILEGILDRIRSLWLRAPCAIGAVDQRIQPQCGYCSFFDDCKNRLGISGDARKYSVKLLPYTSTSIAQQLIDRNFKTVEDVASGIHAVKTGSTPSPLYPELPLLGLKARALIQEKAIYPGPSETHTYTIPRFSPMSISFCAEDTQDDIVFAVGLFLVISVAPGSYLSNAFDHWCTIWSKAIKNMKSVDQIKKELDSVLIKEITRDDVLAFLHALKELPKFTIIAPGETTSRKTYAHGVITYSFAYINRYIEKKGELTLARKFIIKLHAILTICNIIETYVCVASPYEGYYYTPDLGIFYWSPEQLENLQEMLERNLEGIMMDSLVKEKFLELISWITPSDSEVAHPYQHKKFFDMRMFVETILGFPAVINYTWHGILKKLTDVKISPYYWRDNFNYMDFQAWLDYIHLRVVKRDFPKAKAKRMKLQVQVLYKLRAINSLRMEFQSKARATLSNYSKPMRTEKYREELIPKDYHALAQIWYMFSKLNATNQEWEIETIRTVYPEFSIAKLTAGEVMRLKPVLIDDNHFIHEFYLVGLSANMKVAEGDHMFLIPDEKRDMRMNTRSYKWRVIIERIEWDSTVGGYHVITKESNHDLFKEFKLEFDGMNPMGTTWYLYPTTIDAWSRKLYMVRRSPESLVGLLQRYNFGMSWLGFKLAIDWEIGMGNHDLPKIPNSFNAQEVYLFAPGLLSLPTKIPASRSPLFTTIKHVPDKSQAKAIHAALEQVIFGIQGPPGTGKSQTIVALLDEFYHRRKNKGGKKVRVLVTAFSYSALRVVIEKIRRSKTSTGTPTKVAGLQMVFIRSETQDPIQPMPGCRNVDDLLRRGSSWKWNGRSRTVTKTHTLDESLDDDYIIFGNAHQLFYLVERVDPSSFHFDMIVVDEASQVPVDHFLASLQFIKQFPFNIAWNMDHDDNKKELTLKTSIMDADLTKVVIVGDYNQLPPVQPVKPPKNLEKVLESLFSYFVRNHGIQSTQLQTNYRSNQDIVEFTNQMGIYENLFAAPGNRDRQISGDLKEVQEPWVREVLDPSKVVCTIIHDRQFELSVSPFEAELVTRIIMGYFDMLHPRTPDEQRDFWENRVGIVAPHNAQGRLIIHELFEAMNAGAAPRNHLRNAEFMGLLKNTIYSVEKFQGSDREIIVASIGVSDKDQLTAEEDFIYDLNRFNVLTTRAKAKVIMIASWNFLTHIPTERDIMEHASKIRMYALSYCNSASLIYPVNEFKSRELIAFRWKGDSPGTGVASKPVNTEFSLKGGDHVQASLPKVPVIINSLDRLPSDIEKTLVSEDDDNLIWTFQIKDVPRLKKYLPIPWKIIMAHQEWKNGQLEKARISTQNTRDEQPSQGNEQFFKHVDDDLF